MRLAQVVPDIPSGELEDAYTYSVPGEIDVQRGDAVLVPFGHRIIAGFVDSVTDSARPEGVRLREVQEKIEGVNLPENLLLVLDYLADEFAVTPGAAFSAAIPPGIRTRLTTYYEAAGTGGDTPSQVAILRGLEKRGRLSQRALVATAGYSETGLKSLLSDGKVSKSTGLPTERKTSNSSYTIGDHTKARRFISGEGKRKPAQAQCLAAMIDANSTGLSVPEIAALTKVSEATVKAVIDEGFLVSTPESTTISTEAHHRLNAGQSAAALKIGNAISAGGFHRFLLHGITGSGKTEVYLRAIAKALESGRRALFLVPEIALTAQVVAQLRARFGSSVAVMHSGLATGERLRNWRRASNGHAPVVVGARSAIFAPLSNIGVIVMDEEHDGSYKQESSPRYDVRLLAEKRAEIENCVLLCGSATPSINTYYRANKGEFELLKLPKRAAAVSLPDVHVEDLRESYKSKKPSMLSDRLRKELTINMQLGEQSLLFINRRAFARSLLCRDCGFSPQCPRCSVALTYHARPIWLKCHHCGHREKPRDRCPACGSLRIRPLGIGTQKVEQFLTNEFPAMRIARLDRDVASIRGAVDEVFARVRSGETQTLIGTQMIAK
ncbi:MAG: primosomal protein N' [Fimbriimonadales bacterium]